MKVDSSSNNKRIAKNTFALYIRTFITMLVGLYMSRVLLEALGIEDYGINSVVAGIVSMSSLITATMSAAISRYITFAIGRGEQEPLKTIFSTSINAQILLSVVVVIVLEAFGVYFLNYKASIPIDRMYAANIVMQCSIITLVISLISSPYNALIIAHERMTVYAYVSIVDALLKLCTCFAIQMYSGDKLVFFSYLSIIVALVLRLFYGWYCNKNFEEAKYNPRIFDKHLMRELTAFSGWSLVNSGAWTFSTHGVNMLINVFYGVAFNASRQIASTANHAIQSFVQNFTTALAPQITKNYAIGNIDYSVLLVNKGTKYTLLLMLLFVVPVCLEAETILEIWLVDVPPIAALLLRLSMFESMMVSMGTNILRLVQSTGRIKRYSIDVAIYSGLVFPICWIVFYYGAPVWAAYIVFIFIFGTLNIVRYVNVKRLLNFSVRQHFRECLLPVGIVMVISFVLPGILCICIPKSYFRLVLIIFVSLLWTGFCCMKLGMSTSERHFFVSKINYYINKLA